MKFLHAADIHLDSPLAGLQARVDLPGDVIRHCTRRAFEAMVTLAVDEDVAFVVIAGDLYDGDWKDFSTGLFFAEQMRRLGRPCFLLRGNHDAQSVITRGLKLPGNVREFSTRTCETITVPDLGVALHGQSFPNRAVPEDLSAMYRPVVPGMLNIGVLHSSAEDPGEHAVYAPCRVASLALKGYDYWALGHVHARQVLHERPWIVFPGNLQGRHAREIGAKGCTLVTVEDRRIVSVEHRTVDVLRWASLDVDASGVDISGLIERIEQEVLTAVGAAEGRPVLARLTLTGATDLHGALLADTDRLAAECRAAAIAASGELWVEKVGVRTHLAHAAHADMLAPLRSAFIEGLDDPTIVDALLADLAELQRRLPTEARETLALPTDAAGLQVLVEDAWAIVANTLATVDLS
jgi:DNA repair exonuclease SbcCD nuclease subunit